LKYIRYILDISYCGCGDEDVMSVNDNMTDAAIDDMVHDMAMEHATSWEGNERLCWDREMSEEEYEQATEHFYEGVSGSWDYITEEEFNQGR